jgi:hypothetical protein
MIIGMPYQLPLRVAVGPSAFAWLVALTLTVLHAWMLHRYAVNFPLQDDFTQVLAAPGYMHSSPTFREKIAYLFSLSVEHRIVTMRVTSIVQSWLPGGLDFRGLLYFGNVLGAAAALLVIAHASLEHRGGLAAVAALLLFSPSNVMAQYWTTGALQHTAVIAYAFAALACLNRRGASWSTLAVLLGLFAALTTANGLMVLPVGTALLWLSARRRAALFWAAMTLLLFGTYFIGYQAPADRPSILGLAQEPLQLIAYYLSTLGSIGERPVPSALIGALLVFAWAWLLIVRRAQGVSPTLVAWMAFLALSSAAITAGRASLGAEALLTSRYHVYSVFALLVTVAALLPRLGSGAGRRVLPVLMLCAMLWFWHGWNMYVAAIGDLATRQRNSLDHYLLNGHGIYVDFPPQDFGDFMLRRAADIGYFVPESQSADQWPLIASDEEPHAARLTQLQIMPPYVDADGVSVRGLISTCELRTALWLKGDGRQYWGKLLTQRLYREPGKNDWVIFWNTFPLRGVAPGHYRLGYALGWGAQAEVQWTDVWVDV